MAQLSRLRRKGWEMDWAAPIVESFIKYLLRCLPFYGKQSHIWEHAADPEEYD